MSSMFPTVYFVLLELFHLWVINVPYILHGLKNIVPLLTPLVSVILVRNEQESRQSVFDPQNIWNQTFFDNVQISLNFFAFASLWTLIEHRRLLSFLRCQDQEYRWKIVHSCSFSLLFPNFSCRGLDATVNNYRVSKCALVALKTLKCLFSCCCRSRSVTSCRKSGNFTELKRISFLHSLAILWCAMVSCVDISVEEFRMERQNRNRVEAKTSLVSVSFLLQVFGLKEAKVLEKKCCKL